MISFAAFAIEPGSPIYLQLIDFIKRGIVSGRIRQEDVMPSRRVLSALLGVNPNTVQKAYRLLEEESLIVSQTGAKSHVCVDGDVVARLRAELLARDAGSLVRAMKETGLSKAEALRLVDDLWEGKE